MGLTMPTWAGMLQRHATFYFSSEFSVLAVLFLNAHKSYNEFVQHLLRLYSYSLPVFIICRPLHFPYLNWLPYSMLS